MSTPNEASKIFVKAKKKPIIQNPPENVFTSIFNKPNVKAPSDLISHSSFGSPIKPVIPVSRQSKAQNEVAFVEHRWKTFIKSGNQNLHPEIWNGIWMNDVNSLMNIMTGVPISLSKETIRRLSLLQKSNRLPNLEEGTDDMNKRSSSYKTVTVTSHRQSAAPTMDDKSEFDALHSKLKLQKNKPLKELRKRLNEKDVLNAINAFTKRSVSQEYLSEKKKLSLVGDTFFDNDEDPTKGIAVTDADSCLNKKITLEDGTIKKRNNLMGSYLYDLKYNKNTFKKVSVLRYRGRVFRAASKLTSDLPPFPTWTFQNMEMNKLNIKRINVGGQIFCMFKDTLSTFLHTKLSTCISDHDSDGIPFFDRDFLCFNAILNFYRTGRLHIPPNICPTLFEYELEFWGVSENFMEPCCWSEYVDYKTATNKLKKFEEDIDTDANFDNLSDTHFLDLRIKLYQIMTSGTGSVYSRWVSTICALFIVMSIVGMIIGSTPFGRTCIGENCQAIYLKNESVSNFLTRTKIVSTVENLELIFSGFFLSELILRFILCPNRLELFSDTFNWIDFLATTTTLLSNLFTKENLSGSFEGYLLLLKLPRIFRLFKLTANLRSGMDAFTLTIRASANELKLIFVLLLIMTTIFGTLIFVIEMVNESTVAGERSVITNIYFGMWWAIVTMTSVGFGDFVPITTMGYLFGSITIMVGVMICQLPMPIVLKNFTVYNNQANARFNHKPKFIKGCVDPESRATGSDTKSSKRNSNKMFEKIFDRIK